MEIPSHVPPERVVDFDVYNPGRPGDDFHATWRDFQSGAKAPLLWSPRNGGHWIATRGEDVFALYADHERFSSDHNAVPVLPDPQPMLGAIGTDPPDHAVFRRFLALGLTPKNIHARESAIRSLAASLVDGFAASGRCEFIRQYADVLPLTVFLDLVALPREDREMLAAWTGWIVRGADLAARAEGFQRLGAYLAPLILARRGNGDEDLLTQLANARRDGELLPMDEVIGAAVHLMIAGLDTVASILGFVFAHLARNPELQRELATGPARIPELSAEFLRRFPIVVMSRRVRQDVVLHGVQLKKDDMIALPSMLHNLDPAIHAAPLEIRTDRAQKDHCTFGNGVHRCPGALLGRLELMITLQEWFKRIPAFRMEGAGEPPVLGGIVAVVGRLGLLWQAAPHRSPHTA